MDWNYEELVEQVEFLANEIGIMSVEMANTNDNELYGRLGAEIEQLKTKMEEFEYMIEHWDGMAEVCVVCREEFLVDEDLPPGERPSKCDRCSYEENYPNKIN